MVAAVTNQDGEITGLQRTWLDPAGSGKAPVTTPRRATGHLLGHAGRFGKACETMGVGEGIETVLSLQSVLPKMPMAAALSAGHLAAFLPPPGLRRLYVACDRDQAGHWAADRLVGRAQKAGIEAIVLDAPPYVTATGAEPRGERLGLSPPEQAVRDGVAHLQRHRQRDRLEPAYRPRSPRITSIGN